MDEHYDSRVASHSVIIICPACGLPAIDWQPHRIRDWLAITAVCRCGNRWQVNRVRVELPPSAENIRSSG